MVAKKKGSGGSITRSQVVTVRLDPKLKFAAELAARKQRRTISSFIEWAVEQAIENVQITPGIINDAGESVSDILSYIWDVEEADRLVKLATFFPQLLTFEEEQIWKLIREYNFFWKERKKPSQDSTNLAESINLQKVREYWDNLNKIIRDELPEVILTDVEAIFGKKI